jgi:hypothetical protein
MEDLKESSDLLLIMFSVNNNHSLGSYEILGDVYFVVLENGLRLMTFWHKSTTPMMFAVVPTSSLTVLSWGEQNTCVIMGRTRYICYHGENKIHLLSWGEQDTVVIMGRTRYICYHRETRYICYLFICV